METETGKKEQQFKNHSVSSSYSGTSSITSDSSSEHFALPNIPLPRSSMSAAEMQKQRESYVEHQNYLNDMPGYDPNRIPSSVFTTKPPSTSTEWSLASNESLFSIHHGNFSFSMDDYGLSAPVREIAVIEESVHSITEINQVPHCLPVPPPVKKPQGSEKETKPNQVEKSDSESDDEEKGDAIGEYYKLDHKVLVEIEPNVDETKPEDLNSIYSHSRSVSCLSDTSNNSMSSFVFPLFQKESAIGTPSMESKSVSKKRRQEKQLMRPSYTQTQSQPQPQPYSETYTQWESQPQRKPSKQFEPRTQSPKSPRTAWFSCFICPYPRDLFK